MKNDKGFTLVELLAVIVIMGILMMVAIPSVTRTIENSRKDTFVDIAKSYGNAARTLWTSDNLTCNGVVSSAVDDGDYYILINSKEGAKESLPVLVDQGGKSSWGNRDVNGYVRVNISTTPGVDDDGDGVFEKEPKRVTKFYVALSDGTHGLVDDNTLMMDELKRGNVVMTLTAEQLKKIEFTLDDGKLNCSKDANGRYSCTNVTPIKNMTGVCVDDNTTVATVPSTALDINTPIVTNVFYVDKDNGSDLRVGLMAENLLVFGENGVYEILPVGDEEWGPKFENNEFKYRYQETTNGEVVVDTWITMFTVAEDKQTISLDGNMMLYLDQNEPIDIVYTYLNDDGTDFYFGFHRGETWEQYADTLDVVYPSYIDEDGYIYVNDVEGYLVYNDGTFVKATDTIIEKYRSYRFENDLN